MCYLWALLRGTLFAFNPLLPFSLAYTQITYAQIIQDCPSVATNQVLCPNMTCHQSNSPPATGPHFYSCRSLCSSYRPALLQC